MVEVPRTTLPGLNTQCYHRDTSYRRHLNPVLKEEIRLVARSHTVPTITLSCKSIVTGRFVIGTFFIFFLWEKGNLNLSNLERITIDSKQSGGFNIVPSGSSKKKKEAKD